MMHKLFYLLPLVAVIFVGSQTSLAQENTKDASIPGVIDSLANVGKSVGQVVGSNGAYTSTGTGVLTELHEGVFTNVHVIAGSQTIQFIPEATGTPIDVVVVAAWPLLDLALLMPAKSRVSLQGLGMKPAKVSASNPIPGKPVTAVGYPRGLGYSITRGIISGIRTFKDLPNEFKHGRERKPDSKWVQTDCAINPGNSGGPLFNAQLEIVGINTWGSAVDNDIYFALAASEIRGALRSAPTGTVTALKSDSDSTNSIVIALEPPQEFASLTHNKFEGPGFLQLRTTPGSTVLIDGVEIGRTPTTGETVIIDSLPIETEMTLEVQRAGYCSEWGTFLIPVAGLTSRVLLPERPQPTLLTITTIPTNCAVTIDGPVSGSKLLDGSSIDFEDLPIGEYKVTLSRGTRSIVENVVVSPGRHVIVTANFLRGEATVREAEGPMQLAVWLEAVDLPWGGPKAYTTHIKGRSSPTQQGWEGIPSKVIRASMDLPLYDDLLFDLEWIRQNFGKAKLSFIFKREPGYERFANLLPSSLTGGVKLSEVNMVVDAWIAQAGPDKVQRRRLAKVLSGVRPSAPMSRTLGQDFAKLVERWSPGRSRRKLDRIDVILFGVTRPPGPPVRLFKDSW